MSNRILSLYINGLCNFVSRRFKRSLLKTEDIQELRDLSFQILGNKDAFRSNPKSLVKIYYTLVRAYNTGFFNHKPFPKFPYVHNFYSNNYHPNDLNSENSETDDPLLTSCRQYFKKNVDDIILTSFKNNLSPSLLNLFSSKPDESTSLLNLNIKLLIELWLKNSPDPQIINSINSHITNQTSTVNSIFSNWHSLKSSNKLTQLIDLFSLLTLTKTYNEDIILKFSQIITSNFTHLDLQSKLKSFFSLCTLKDNPIVSTLLNQFLTFFKNQIHLLQLSDSITLLSCFKSLSFQNNTLDKMVDFQFLPKFENITILNMFLILEAFVHLDYRCSKFTQNITSNYLRNLTKEDLSILKSQLSQLHQPTHHLGV